MYHPLPKPFDATAGTVKLGVDPETNQLGSNVIPPFSP